MLGLKGEFCGIAVERDSESGSEVADGGNLKG